MKNIKIQKIQKIIRREIKITGTKAKNKKIAYKEQRKENKLMSSIIS